MKRKSLTDYNEQELQQAIKSRRFLFGSMLGMQIVMCGLILWDLYEGKKFTVQMTFPLIFGGILYNTWSDYKKAKDEMDNRKLGK